MGWDDHAGLVSSAVMLPWHWENADIGTIDVVADVKTERVEEAFSLGLMGRSGHLAH
ncbi:hypothetical protein Pfo_025849, partial [Paulownia fortunei]